MYASRKFWRPDLLIGARPIVLCLALLAPLQDGRAESIQEPTANRTEPKIPFKRSEESTAGVALRILGGLVVTVLIGIGVVYGMKRFLPTMYRPMAPGDFRIQILEARRLTPKTTLFLVELSGTRLLLAQSGDGITTLHRFPAADPSGANTDRV